MLSRVLLGIALSTIASIANAAELFSVRCEYATPPRPYFATFDTVARKVVFESPSINPASSEGMRAYVGDIDPSSNPAGSKIEFALKADGGKLLAAFDDHTNRMIWPGVGSEATTLRPPLSNRCIKTPPRSILSFRSLVPVEHPISVRCEDSVGPAFYTMDTDSRRAYFERGGIGSSYESEVTDVQGGVIYLLLKFDRPRNASWNQASQIFTIDEIEGDPSYPKSTYQCKEVSPRTVMDYFNLRR